MIYFRADLFDSRDPDSKFLQFVMKENGQDRIEILRWRLDQNGLARS